jgi:prefoldin subunit 2
MASFNEEDNNPEIILGTYRRMTSECQQLTAKIGELNLEKDEYKLVMDTLEKLEDERKAYQLIGGILAESKVSEVKPTVSKNFEGITVLLEKLNENLTQKDTERKAYKEKHGIMTQEEKEQEMKRKAREAEREAKAGAAASKAVAAK